MTTTYNKNSAAALAPKVFALLRKIPRGKVTSYGFLAKQIGVHPRLIGRILHHNTDPDNNPCHRVIHTDGSLAGGYVFGGLDIQKHLLEAEGVKFNNQQKAEVKYFVTKLC